MLYGFCEKSWTLPRAEFWAEDGIEFFLTAHDEGIKSLIKPVWGYHFLYGRIVAWFATFFDVYWSPYFYNWFTLFVDVFSIGYFSRKSFAWIIPEKSLRIFITILIVIGPGNEAFYGLCQYSPLTFLGFLMLLEKPWNPSMNKIIAFVFLAFSSGTFFTLIPCMLYLYYISKRYNYLLLVILSLVPAIINAIGTIDPQGNSVKLKTLNVENIRYFFEICVSNFFVRLVVPMLGDLLTYKVFLIQNYYIFIYFSLLIYFLFLLKTRATVNHAFNVIMLAFLGFIGMLGLTAIARESSLEILLIKTGINWQARYFFLPGAVAIMVWSLITFKIRLKLYKKVFCIPIGLMLLVNLNHWNDISPRTDLKWKESAQEIQETLNKKRNGTLAYSKDIMFYVHPGFGVVFSIKPDEVRKK